MVTNSHKTIKGRGFFVGCLGMEVWNLIRSSVKFRCLVFGSSLKAVGLDTLGYQVSPDSRA